MSNLTPVPKVAAATFGGALATLLVWGLHQFAGIVIPPEVAGSFATIVAFAAGWVTPSA